jgi:hypothetical protein
MMDRLSGRAPAERQRARSPTGGRAFFSFVTRNDLMQLAAQYIAVPLGQGEDPPAGHAAAVERAPLGLTPRARARMRTEGCRSPGVDHPVTLGSSSMLRTQAVFHSALLICVARSQNPMQSARPHQSPRRRSSAGRAGEASGDSAMFGRTVPPVEN